MLQFIYRYLLMPMGTVFFLLLGPLFNRKIRRGLVMRLPNRNKKNPQALALCKTQGCLWIHCSSGEFEYAKPVIRRIKEEDPNRVILVTYFSPSYKEQIEATKEVDLSCPLPWDLQTPVLEFIRKYNPKALLIARTDLWPEVLYQCHRAQVPALLFSYTSSSNTTHTNTLISYFKSWRFQWLDQVFCVSQRDQKLLSLPKTPVTVAGDTRYDQVLYRLQHPRPINEGLFHSLDQIPCLVAGSTWPEDEAVLIEALSPLIKDQKLKLVLAPHEPSPEHLSSLLKKIQACELKHTIYSQSSSWKSEEVLVIDQVGILADLYIKGSLAFVGGSFRKNVHSVMEPLAAGNVCFVGPYSNNNGEVVLFKNHPLSGNENQETAHNSLQLVNVIQNGKELKEKIRHYLQSTDRHRMWKDQILNEVKKQRGATQMIIDWLNKQP